MNISGIRPSLGFYDQNLIRFNPELGIAPVEEAPAVAPVEESSSPALTDEEIAVARRGQTFGSYDFASQYKPDSTYELKGADSDIKSLDVEKAVSDMEKDSAIHRYQYFVQNKQGENNTVPIIRGAEDFSL